jgi:hypothetical protein
MTGTYTDTAAKRGAVARQDSSATPNYHLHFGALVSVVTKKSFILMSLVSHCGIFLYSCVTIKRPLWGSSLNGLRVAAYGLLLSRFTRGPGTIRSLLSWLMSFNLISF